ncbi:aspartate/glutamate racemase family protein [Alkalicoccus urumqiensis]|uniref:Aspartate racemase n=1 Tax=Alkalicoccus urumqiensis TaxID=1548213 RepID=A0A2P6MK62_ALKUR|nr:amino acid racemase [Alkalicoccus urumqiensis]PRO66651.1 hypothetical protein C6I21_04730 [Alkalicoccus urumqiensis]
MLGLLGGMSWESSAVYYRELNTRWQKVYGPYSAAPVVMTNVDFPALLDRQRHGDRKGMAEVLLPALHSLRAAGADACALCSNTAHLALEELLPQAPLPVLSITEAVLENVQPETTDMLLLGTEETMTSRLYHEPLEARGVNVHIPPAAARERLQRIIFTELVTGTLTDVSRRFIQKQMQGPWDEVLLGCTELQMAVPPASGVLDSTSAHIDSCFRFLMDG